MLSIYYYGVSMNMMFPHDFVFANHASEMV
jgi:hypothetical protein